MRIRAHDKAVCTLLSELNQLLEQEGGANFNNALLLNVKGADLSYEVCGKLADMERTISLPVDCMPVLEHYDSRLVDSSILVIEKAAREASGFQQKIMQLQHELYNRLNKVAEHARHSAAVQLRHFPRLHELLLKGGNGLELLTATEAGEESLRIRAFWQARMFHEVRSKKNRALPMLEFMNHHLYANNFKYNTREVDGSWCLDLYHKNLLHGKTFARYEIMDALQTCVIYGFVDYTPYFIQSQAFEMALVDGLRLKVSNQAICSYQSDVPDWNPPPKFSNSFMYRSRLLFGSEGPIMPYAIVPPSTHMEAYAEALEAQLEEIERHYGLEAGVVNNEKISARFMNTLYACNKDYYQALLKLLRQTDWSLIEKSSTVQQQLKLVLKKQQSILKDFSVMLK